ncbi:MAG: hypothetical protein KQ78_01246 [Candidatus Izimaplasma bacterium HR2]|nr:MAG: hypothetical protein KQ78_01246 [Candidatus Izimaplasma bacterium HR2]
MAGVIAHVYIAKKLLEDKHISVANKDSFTLGSIAPDAIMSKMDYHRDDKKISHLRKGISSDNWYLKEYKDLFQNRITEYYKSNIENRDNSFALGYLVHLLTDQAFHYTFRLDINNILKDKNLPHTGKDLLKVMTHELDTLDYKLLDDKPDLLNQIDSLRVGCKQNEIKDLIDSDSLCKNFDWISSKYRHKQDKNYEFLYFKDNRIENLISTVTNYIIEQLKTLSN